MEKFTLQIGPGEYVIEVFNGAEIVGTFYEKELLKTKQKVFRTEKVIKEKGDKLYVKWNNGYDNSFKIWINSNDKYYINK